MDYFKFFPIIMSLIDMAGKIREALSTGSSVFKMLEQFGPGVLELLKNIGAALWPNMAVEDQVQAAAQKMVAQDTVRSIQTNLNKVMSAGLTVDGDYGKKTKDAVTAFQTKFRVDPADGWSGKVTASALQVEANRVG